MFLVHGRISDFLLISRHLWHYVKKCWILFNSVSPLVASSETYPAGKVGHCLPARGAEDNPMGDGTPSLLVGGGWFSISIRPLLILPCPGGVVLSFTAPPVASMT